MKEQIKLALWNKVKSTYPSGTSKHTNALLEDDFESFIDEVVKICAIPNVVEQCEHDYDYYRNQYGEEVRFCCKCLKGYF